MKESKFPIRKIEIEIHSYCNRKCEWCPNSIYDRNFYQEMEDNIFSKIIDELRDIDYKGLIFFTRYNEPLINKDYLNRRIREVRNKLPDNKIGVNTNGDFGWDNLDVDFLTVTDYDCKFDEICEEEKGIRIMRLKNLCNRGGILNNNKKLRDFPCYEPTYTAGIDYLGNIFFCCNMRFDDKTHLSFGNIRDITLKEAYLSPEAISFRERVKNMDFPNPCKFCIMKPGRFSRKNYSLCCNMEDYSYE
jgi:biotin synthase-like enzyme